MFYDFRDPSYIYKADDGKLISAKPEMIITNTCVGCAKKNKILINEKDFKEWKGTSEVTKKMVQHVFLWLSMDQKELLITGTHNDCWDMIFAER